jgi:signal transduction histidine kinase
MRRSIYPIAVGVVSAILAVLLWTAIVRDHDARVTEVTNAISYAARSDLVRRLHVQFEAFRNVSEFWATFAQLPPEQWESDAQIELAHFDGVEIVAWSDRRTNARFYTDSSSRLARRQPTAEEWERVTAALATAYEVDSEFLSSPTFDDQGRAHFTFHSPVHGDSRNGVLVAIIDMYANLRTLLQDGAPGYAVTVSCCNGAVLYGSPGASPEENAPTAQGWIEVLPGVTWSVAHRATPELVAELRPVAVHAALAFGLALSALLSALLYQSGLAAERAKAAAAAEAQVRVVNANLEATVAARTKSLDVALRDLNTINLSVSHDLRSPLNAITMQAHRLAQIGADGPAGEDHMQTAKTLLANAERMAAILDRLLDFSRASGFEYSASRVDLQALAHKVVDEIRGGNEARIDFAIGDLPPAAADPTMMHVLLTNLIDNAVKFTRTIPAPLIRIGHQIDDGTAVYFVADNGPGFDAGASDEIFQPLKRLDAGNKTEGLGLGLAIAARIVERHGGRIWATSNPKEGAIFYFTLPQWTG